MGTQKKITILGIDFIDARALEVVDQLKSGGFLVVPSAPGLITIQRDREYYQSLMEADLVIPDSGYMVLLWNLFHKEKISRISGLEFLIAFFADQDVKATSNLLLVNPRPQEAEANLTYLRSIGFTLNNTASYLAPLYNSARVIDEVLLALIEAQKPKYVIINVGGGIQEKLGAYLKRNLTYKPGIICTGAAIAFLTGEQATIPLWADKLFLGWLFRCIQNPKLYVPRYFGALKLVTLMLQYGKNAPV